MDSQKAKFVLQSYRGEGKDAHDPYFDGALRVAEQNPELNAWLAEELARDHAVRRKLKEFPVPEGLRERILSRRGFPQTESARSKRSWLALAAAVGLLAAVAAAWFGQRSGPTDFLSYRTKMVEFVSGPVQLGFKSDKLAEVQQWLASHDVIGGYEIPVGLQAQSGIGCRDLRWNGKAVGLICFLGEGGQVVHLFIAPRSAVSDAPPAAEPAFATVNGWNTATWTRGNFVYVIASQQDRVALEKLL